MHAPSATLNRSDKFVIVRIDPSRPARRLRRSLSASLPQSRGHRLRALEGRRPGDGPGAAAAADAAALVGVLEAAGAFSAQLQTLEAKAHGSSRSEWRQWTEQRRRRERGVSRVTNLGKRVGGLGCMNLASALLGAFARKAHSRNLPPFFVTMN